MMENVRKSIKTSTFQTKFNGENANGYSQTQPLDAINTNKMTICNSDKTCQTCKHWSNNLKKKPKFVATSTGKCKEIFKELTASDSDLESYLPFFEDLTTRDTFGCNGYEQANNGNL